MTDYELHQRRFAELYDRKNKTKEVLGEVSVPDDAIAVNTTPTASAPTIAIVTWLEPTDD